MSFKDITEKNFKGIKNITLRKGMTMDGALSVGMESRRGDSVLISESFQQARAISWSMIINAKLDLCLISLD